MGQLSAYFTVSTPEEITKKELLRVGENNVDEAQVLISDSIAVIPAQ